MVGSIYPAGRRQAARIRNIAHLILYGYATTNIRGSTRILVIDTRIMTRRHSSRYVERLLLVDIALELSYFEAVNMVYVTRQTFLRRFIGRQKRAWSFVDYRCWDRYVSRSHMYIVDRSSSSCATLTERPVIDSNDVSWLIPFNKGILSNQYCALG